MKLAASNIGWAPRHEDPARTDEMLRRLPNHGVAGLVIAPTMVWPEAPAVTGEQAAEFRGLVEDAGLRVVGMQSLTFGLKDAALSGDPEAMRRLSEHLKRQAELAGHLGATTLIFGSPGLRKGVNPDEALEVFAGVSSVAANNGTRLCIEPLSGYGNEFVTTSLQGAQFVDTLRRAGYGDGVGLHLDSAAIAGQPNANPALDIFEAQRRIGIHSFDASAPELGPIDGEATVNHADMGAALRLAGYTGYVSLEMRPPQGADPMRAYLNNVDFMRDRY